MSKIVRLIHSIIIIALVGTVVVLLASLNHIVYAESQDNTVTSDVSVSGDGITEGYTYYLEWNNLSVIYNGSGQTPSAVLKCYEDDSFAIESTVTVKDNLGLAVNAVDARKYVAVAECEGINFSVGDNEKEFTISPLNITVEWDKSSTYIYNGNEQGPKASYKDVNNNTVPLITSGLETNAGTYTASVSANAAGANYALTNLTCDFLIEKFVAKTFWVVADYYVENGKAQGPRAFGVGVNGEIIELPVSNLAKEAGDHIAKIDIAEVNVNFNLTGELTFKYIIEKEKPLGVVGIVFVSLFGVILCALLGLIVYFILFQKGVMKRIQKDDIELEEAKAELKSLNEELESANRQLAEKTKPQKSDAASKKKIKTLENSIKILSEENERLKADKSECYKHPIEEYFPEIDKAFKRAYNCEYDSDDPKGSYYSQRQELETINKLISIYRSQRR